MSNEVQTVKGSTTFHFIEDTAGGGFHGVSFCIEPAAVCFQKSDVSGDDVRAKLSAMESDSEFQAECVLAVRASLLPILRRRMKF